MDLEDRRGGDVGQGTGVEAAVGLGVDEVEHLQVVKVQLDATTLEHGEVVVVQATVADVDAGEGATDELGLAGGSKLEAGQAVGDGVDAVGNGQLALELADDIGHGGGRHEVHVALVGQAELVGDDDAVDAALLQGLQVTLRVLDGALDGALADITRIAGQRVQVQHRDDGLLDAKKLLGPKHVILPFPGRSGHAPHPTQAHLCPTPLV